jgi:hypothetical protein
MEGAMPIAVAVDERPWLDAVDRAPALIAQRERLVGVLVDQIASSMS